MKILEGTARADRMNRREPKPPKAGRVTPRPGLPRGVQREFARLVELLRPMEVLTVSDVAALELLAGASDEYWREHRVCVMQGSTYRTKNAAGSTMYRTRPEVAIAADAWRRAAGMLQQFGLTPAARTRVEAEEPTPARRAGSMDERKTEPGVLTGPSRFFRRD
jgi:P27 family predicted phage terminase small subunit